MNPSRRTVLRTGLVAGSGTAALLTVRNLATAATASLPSQSAGRALATSTACATLTKEETQGPFWVDERLNRSDVRYDTGSAGDGTAVAGVPLTLTINLQDAGASCSPQAGAYVDIWHADAQGAYSDVSGSGNPDEVGHNFLRGYQVSDSSGQVRFTTIWPGWYTGRTIHIHVRVRLALDSSTTVNFTTQIFFDESVNNTVVAQSAYQKSGTRTTNAQDGIYDASLLMPVTGSVSAGYAGTFTVALDFGDGTSSGSGSDTVVSASVADAAVVTRRGRRVVKIAVAAEEQVTGRIRLVRHDDVLAVRTWGWLPSGRHTVRLKVPRSVSAGPAKVVVNLADRAGNQKIVRKRVQVPAR